MAGAFPMQQPQVPQQTALQQPAAYDLSKPQGMIQPGNLDPFHRKVLQNDNGTYSTTRSFSIQTDKGETLIPQVVEGKLLSKRQAIAHFMRTGQHFGIFQNPDTADAYATALHNAQASVIEQKTKAPTVQGAFQQEQDYQPPTALPAGPIPKATLDKMRARQGK